MLAEVPDSVDFGWGLGISISSKFSGDADVLLWRTP